MIFGHKVLIVQGILRVEGRRSFHGFELFEPPAIWGAVP